MCRQALAATQCDLSCNLPPRLARAELGSAGLPARRASDHCMDSEFDDVEITRDVSRINKEAVICNKAALHSVHARAVASCRPVRYRLVIVRKCAWHACVRQLKPGQPSIAALCGGRRRQPSASHLRRGFSRARDLENICRTCWKIYRPTATLCKLHSEHGRRLDTLIAHSSQQCCNPPRDTTQPLSHSASTMKRHLPRFTSA